MIPGFLPSQFIVSARPDRGCRTDGQGRGAGSTSALAPDDAWSEPVRLIQIESTGAGSRGSVWNSSVQAAVFRE